MPLVEIHYVSRHRSLTSFTLVEMLILPGLYVAACCLTVEHTTPLLSIKPDREREAVLVLERFIVVLCRFSSCAHGDTSNLFKRFDFFASRVPTRSVQIRHTTQGKTQQDEHCVTFTLIIVPDFTFLVFNSQFTDATTNKPVVLQDVKGVKTVMV